jgi:integrase
MKEIFAQLRDDYTLIPVSEENRLKLKSYKPNQILRVEVYGTTRQRSVLQNKWIHSIFRLVAENMEDQDWNTPEKVKRNVKMAMRFFKDEVIEPVPKITPTEMTYFEMAEYFRENKRLKPASKNRMKTARNQLEKFKPGLTYKDITVNFLNDFEYEVSKRGGSPATISGYMTDIRTVINYHRNITKFIPQDYKYPFGAGGYGIRTYFPSKVVLRAEEIQSIAELTDFETKVQEWARDIWLFLYRCNGINFVDLLAMRWDYIKGGCFFFYRTKTKTTRRSNIKPISVPIDDKLQAVLDKIGVKDSPFIIGKMKEGYTETTLTNKSHKLCAEINKELKYVTQKLDLSLSLVLDIARDSYATTLNRNGRPINHIAELMGHASPVITSKHYVGQLSKEQVKEINSCLF